jgi:hypothetical protein
MTTRPKHGHSELLRAFLKAEKALKAYVPTPRPDPPEPRNADETLAALAATYRPGDAVGLQQVVDCIAITWEQARAVRAWAEFAGAWPYARPGPSRPPTLPGSVRRRRKDGAT